MTPGGAIVTSHAHTGTHREDHFPVDLNQPLVLDVHNPNGDVAVRAVERTDVLVSRVTHGLPEGFDEDVLIIDAHENRIEVRVDPRIGAGWSGDFDLEAVVGQITKAFRWGDWSSVGAGRGRAFPGGRAWCDISIEIPRAIGGRVTVHTASGDVQTEDVASEIALNTASGDVRVARASGTLTVQTASGDVDIKDARGHLRARSASGDVRVTSSQIEGFDVQTASGDLLLDALLTGDGHCSAQTASGDVRLTLRRPAGEAEPSANLAFHTLSGDAHVSPPFRKIERRRWQAGSGEGGPRIEVTTASGDLSAGFAAVDGAFAPAPSPATFPVESFPTPPAAPAPPVAPTPPAAPPAPEARGESGLAASDASPEGAPLTPHVEDVRQAVLEAVERGEIDIEEALRRLEAADGSPGV